MASSSRSDVLRMGAVLVALLVVTALVLVVTGGGSAGSSDRTLLQRDGLLTEVEPDRIVLEASDGGGTVTFAVRPLDARRLDLVHLQAHRDQGLASRVFYQREGGKLYALRVDDLQTSGP